MTSLAHCASCCNSLARQRNAKSRYGQVCPDLPDTFPRILQEEPISRRRCLCFRDRAAAFIYFDFRKTSTSLWRVFILGRTFAGVLQRMMRHEGEMKSWRSPFSLSVYKAFCSKDEFCRNTDLTEQQCLLTKASHSQELCVLVSYRFTGGTSGLNNYLQKQNRLAAVSWVESSSGPPNKPTWTMTCKIDGEARGTGTGAQKHVAKDAAADQALAYLKGG
ncbi:hypothetical protein ARMGADRAFT_575417 [Armillaria gallica]|uniref:DRBM domain-containing protein n=1 Tax=Armillaria gallica TaxID=47427 RepID=A0A2H3DT50_ARMGA|nr:hypothetical protein ARMGADRAFT_575417 [Armillaria gallica]